jgi:hypothetical protein
VIWKAISHPDFRGKDVPPLEEMENMWKRLPLLTAKEEKCGKSTLS